MQSRSVNWLDHTARSLVQHFPELQAISHQLAERLSRLLLERLPERLSLDILDLLPEDTQVGCSKFLKADARSEANPSIGYPDFVQKTAATIGCADVEGYRQKLEQGEQTQWLEKVTHVFLWAVAQDLPVDLKQRMKDVLPMELRARMDLSAAISDESKVA